MSLGRGEKESAKKGRSLTTDEVASLSKGKQKKRKGFAPPFFLVCLGEMSQERLVASFPAENETASPSGSWLSARSPDVAAHPSPTGGKGLTSGPRGCQWSGARRLTASLRKPREVGRIL